MAEEQPAEQPAQPPAQPPQEQPAQPPQQPQQPQQTVAAPAQPSGKPSSTPFILALIGGILILINGIILAMAGALFASFATMVPGVEMMMALLAGMIFIAPVFGVLVIVGAILMRSAGRAKMGGILTLIFSIVAFIFGGGFLVGGILGIVGGALALKG